MDLDRLTVAQSIGTVDDDSSSGQNARENLDVRAAGFAGGNGAAFDVVTIEEKNILRLIVL